MTKYLVVALIILASFLFIYFGLKRKDSSSQKASGEASQKLTYEFSQTPVKEIESESKNGYKTVWLILRDTQKLELYSNLTEDLTSQEALNRHSCGNLVSGSFYNQEDKHIGLFISESKILSNSQENSTFNGYFFVDSSQKAYVTVSAPGSARLGLQSGPLLLKDGKVLTLKLERDEDARRIIVATTKKDEVVFIAIYDKSNTLSGPKLSSVAGILSELQENTALELKDAINLDGGSHSAFLTNLVRLPEVAKIGSYFCIKP